MAERPAVLGVDRGREWIAAEVEDETGLLVFGALPDDFDPAAEEAAQVTAMRDRSVRATRRERQWEEVHYAVKVMSASEDRAKALRAAIAARLDDRLNETLADGTIVHYCERVGTYGFDEAQRAFTVFHRGVEFEVKIRPPR